MSSNISKNSVTNIVAQKGIVKNKKIFLLNGQIISTDKDNTRSEIIKFDQLNIDLSNINTNTIKIQKYKKHQL